jgi:hypothetical protein
MINLISKILCSAIKNLFENQPDIFDFTSQTGETEWNLCHHFANEIHKYIFCKRGINALNFLAIETKCCNVDVSTDI